MIGNIKWKKTAARWFAGEEAGQGLVEYEMCIRDRPYTEKNRITC